MTRLTTTREPGKQRGAVLSVSPAEEDHLHLQNVFSDPQRALFPDVEFSVTAKSTVSAAKGALKHGRISIVLCEHHLSLGSWTELLGEVEGLPAPPVIVTSRLADERMWAEVLNLGGYDVLAKPFNSEEVLRTITSAWSLWQHQFRSRAGRPETASGTAA